MPPASAPILDPAADLPLLPRPFPDSLRSSSATSGSASQPPTDPALEDAVRKTKEYVQAVRDALVLKDKRVLEELGEDVERVREGLEALEKGLEGA